MDLVNLVAKDHGLNIKGVRFDFFNPDENFKIEPNSAILTMAALEQVGKEYGPLLDFFLKNTPQLCINMEPTLEFYDDNLLVDYLAKRYHLKRNYLNGYYSKLEGLQKKGQIEILKSKRLFFGSLFQESFSYYVWRPSNASKGEGF